MSKTAHTSDGRALNYEQHGEGTPTVVFESGMGFSRNVWGAVVPSVAARTTAVLYDRSGLGSSDPDPNTRDLVRLADDLVALLDHLGSGPFVLVGHSWGGPIVRVAAATAPDRIAGIVLVDPSDEGCDLVFGPRHARMQRQAARVLPVVTRLGLMRVVVRRQARFLPEPWSSGLRAEDGTVSAMREQLGELRTSTDDLRELRDEPPVLPDVPVSVISGTKVGLGERWFRAELVDAHRKFAAGLPRGRHVRADQSTHYIPFTEPALIASEVVRIVDDTT